MYTGLFCMLGSKSKSLKPHKIKIVFSEVVGCAINYDKKYI